MTLSCIIVDDEDPAIRVLERYISNTPWLRLEASFTHPGEAREVIQDAPPDLLFLDIQMPGLTGLELLHSLDHPPLVIFTTAHPDYALQGFELAAVDYLLKPISQDRFLRAATRALQLKGTGKPAPEHFVFRADRRLYRLAFESILFIQAYGDYLKIQTPGKQYMPKMKLADLEDRLPTDQFQRVHRSWIINFNEVQYLEGNQVLIAGQHIPVSESYKEGLVQLLGGKSG